MTLNNQSVEIVSTFKYLGTTLDAKLSFECNADNVFKKGCQRSTSEGTQQYWGQSVNLVNSVQITCEERREISAELKLN